jgi:hypothetical protein
MDSFARIFIMQIVKRVIYKIRLSEIKNKDNYEGFMALPVFSVYNELIAIVC